MSPSDAMRAENHVRPRSARVTVGRMNVTGPLTTATARATSSPVSAA